MSLGTTPDPKKKAAPDQGKAASQNQQHINFKAIASRSTSTAPQRVRALELLKIAPQTTYSLRKKGISHPAQRLKELIQDGYPITKTTVTAVDSDGYTHVGVALYALEKSAEPIREANE